MKTCDDGITHINIYSKGKTEIGRFLSNFYPCSIKTIDGWFSSVEGYWYWMGIRNHPDADNIRGMNGFKAKEFGEYIKPSIQPFYDKDFEKKILRAIYYKCAKNNDLIVKNKGLLALPLEHYYVYGDKIVNVKKRYSWLIDGIDKVIDMILFLY